ncbi:MAG TPA: NAD(P)/FAD-dependent oxidoreductase [Clostridia bacterium]|jgi:NADPH-dependent 2,4-dienoyl-CoA reductase/sulfur reductase-like enzyme
MIRRADVCVIGGGPAGIEAAKEAKCYGAKKVIIIEREKELGGILNQCIHVGFGLKLFKEELTGPEYAQKIAQDIPGDIEVLTETYVLSIDNSLLVTAISQKLGLVEIQAGAIVLAMGCREKPRGALDIGGTRPSGIFTAGTAQRLLKLYGKLVGKDIVIMGTYDLGLIMARRFTYEKANVKMVVESRSYYMGLSRNVAECINDLNIPMLLNTKVIEVLGKERLEAVKIAPVDQEGNIDLSKARIVECDTLVLAAGLVPENEIAKNAGVELNFASGGAVTDQYCQTSVKGMFACGNVLYVHDLADQVTDEAKMAGMGAARYAMAGFYHNKQKFAVKSAGFTKYTMPCIIQKTTEPVKLYIRVKQAVKPAYISVKCGDREIYRKNYNILIHGEMQPIILNGKDIDDDIEVYCGVRV